MNDNIKILLDEAAREDEPPPRVDSDDLVQRGRRHKRRLAGYTASGATFAVAAIAAVALLVPGLTGGRLAGDTDDRAPAADGGGDADNGGDTGGESTWSMDTSRLSEEVREALKTAFPDVSFTMASGWNVGTEPFDLTEYGEADVGALAGYGQDRAAGFQLVGVELYLPGNWNTEPSDSASVDRDADEHLIDCGSGTDGDIKVTTDCDSDDLGDRGLLRTAELTETSGGKPVGYSLTSVVYRDDGTAVVLRTECHGEGTEVETSCDRGKAGTHDPEAAEVFLTTVPSFAREELRTIRLPGPYSPRPAATVLAGPRDRTLRGVLNGIDP